MNKISITESIKERRSVRSYAEESINNDVTEKIKSYIKQIQPLFGINIRVELIHTQTGSQPVKLGTYGFIKGASDFLVMLYEDREDLTEVSAGYFFEQIVLYCTQLGLGTCWLGASFKQKDFLQQIHLKANEKIRIVSPIGYKIEKMPFKESFMRKTIGSDKRKPFGTLFFQDDFTTPLTETSAGIYNLPLQMLRLAPSASNQQPWRAIVRGNEVHFYHHPAAIGGFSRLDLGIGLCHFRETCLEKGIPGELKVLNNPQALPQKKGEEYMISWINE